MQVQLFEKKFQLVHLLWKQLKTFWKTENKDDIRWRYFYCFQPLCWFCQIFQKTNTKWMKWKRRSLISWNCENPPFYDLKDEKNFTMNLSESKWNGSMNAHYWKLCGAIKLVNNAQKCTEIRVGNVIVGCWQWRRAHCGLAFSSPITLSDSAKEIWLVSTTISAIEF